MKVSNFSYACSWVLLGGLIGMFFWTLGKDTSFTLLNAIAVAGWAYVVRYEHYIRQIGA